MYDLPDKYRTDLEIIRQTTLQILRDFKNDDFEIHFSGNENKAFDELKNQLLPEISRLIKNDKHAFRSLLYRVDISEKDYQKILDETRISAFEEKICEMIIRREFQKVITRIYFSKKQS